ncbi:hypothetical protein [Oligoflexus tunisiensis]|uniref:hypothetical protein n=1 Tax=Oligoflexus tunisiensis TaxID=708132 RepID=UPI00114D1164|nr:hypothetical protein [Oligoflexus tunisiensis]
MRALLVSLLLMTSTGFAAERQSYFMLMPASWYGYHWEETPEGNSKSSEQNTIITAAWRSPYFGLSLGGSWLQNTSHARDSRIRLSGQGLSLGFVGAGFVSAFYTFLYKPRLDYEFPALDARTSYYDGSGSIVDFGLHFGSGWFRFGPRVLLIDVDYRSSSVTSGTETESAALEGSPWRDRWVEPYLGIWLIF